MKKKFISFLITFCLVFPCFFAVACKDKAKENDSTKAYTYSVVLKNAKGKIDESALNSEYDYDLQKNAEWASSENDYTISVTRKNVLSGALTVSLLEGYDYSDILFTVNKKEALAEVRSGEILNCEAAYHLKDREFSYTYQKMKSNTEVVVDFSNCEMGKVEIDLSGFSSRGIKSYKVISDFVTINTNKQSALEEITTETVEVEYGTTLAFDCPERLVYKTSETNSNYKALEYAQYASKFYAYDDTQNVLQYLRAEQTGSCAVYSAEKDISKNGTLRIVGFSDIKAYLTLDDLLAGNKLTYSTEYEIYNKVSLKTNIVNSSKIFIRLEDEAKNYSYHLTSSIDEKLANKNYVQPKTIESTDGLYLELDISGENGSFGAAKYLVRRPLLDTEYYIVSPKDFGENTRFKNPDYVLFGTSNKPSTFPMTYSGNIFFGFSATKNVEIEMSEITKDKATGFDQRNTFAEVRVRSYDRMGPINNVPVEITDVTNFSQTVVVDCYEEDDYGFYEVSVSYEKENFSHALVGLDVSNLGLYEGETVYLASDLSSSESWSELTSETQLSIKSEKSGTKFYYFDSDREDSTLVIRNLSGEIVSLTGRLTDCFGRPMKGTITIDGKDIDLSKVYYLDIVPGYYGAYTANLVREFDKTYHNINMSGLKDSVTMISVGGYSEDGRSFKNSLEIDSLKIRYGSITEKDSIYYYIIGYTNQYMQLKNSDGDVVSTNALVLDEYDNPLMIDGFYVYELKLNGSYHKEDEVFEIEVLSSTYNLVDEHDETFEIFASSDVSGSPEAFMVLNQTYYFVGEINKRYLIVEYETGIVVEQFTMVETIDSESAVFSFKLTFPSDKNYVNRTSFKIVANDI